MPTIQTIKNATISACGSYRYSLWRSWNPPGEAIKTCLFVGLNPSTADHQKDDPTIRRMIGFAQREGYNQLQVVNLYAFRTPSPKVLAARTVGNGENSIGEVESVGPQAFAKRVNDSYIDEAAKNAGLIIAAWGAHPMTKRNNRDREVLSILCKHNHVFVLADGNIRPNHPLYLSKDAPLEEYGDIGYIGYGI